MAEEKLRLRARGTALVPDYESHESGTRRFIGWKHDPTIGPEFTDRVSGQKKHHGGFVQLDGDEAVVEKPVRGEYIRHLRDGDLWPADQATAQLANVPFDGNFGEAPEVPHYRSVPAPASKAGG